MSLTAEYMATDAALRSVDIGHLVNCIIEDALKGGASDIHIEPWESGLAVRLRLNGVLSELVELPLELMEKVSGRLKVMSDLVSFKSSLPQEGHANAVTDSGQVELRVSVFPTTRGEKIVVRLFNSQGRSLELSHLGFDERTLKQFVKLLERPSGLILLTGPTGSGKTTAIYSALYHIVQRSGSSISISTLEDPVEYNLPMVSHAQINLAQDFTYARGLRSLMRQDPQVIMVGEIRDAETASIAVQAGLTGHLVISTIHSGIASGVFARLIHMEIEPFLLASSIIGILGIRLIRKNCHACSQPCHPDPALLRLIPEDIAANTQFRRGEGCADSCTPGFSGRRAVTELLIPDEVIRDAILQKLPTRALQDIAIQQGMQTMWQCGLRSVLAGETTLDEVLRVVAMDQI